LQPAEDNIKYFYVLPGGPKKAFELQGNLIEQKKQPNQYTVTGKFSTKLVTQNKIICENGREKNLKRLFMLVDINFEI
jgi:hypothetical protein